MVDPTAAARLARRIEPCHGFIYFAPEAAQRYADLGVEAMSGYFASRSAPMGAVDAEVVVATFFNFKPSKVREAMAGVWDTASPDALVAARFQAADDAYRRMLGDDITSPQVIEAGDLARRAAETARPEGRALFAGLAHLPWPDEPHLAFFHAITLLREYRGDGHIAALLLEGLDAVEALITHAASGLLKVPANLLQSTRGWTDDEWAAGKQRLAERGLLDADGALTPEGRAQRDRIEAQTTSASLQPLEAIGDDGVARLNELVGPFAKTIAEATFGRAR
jgi:hypothetical protein